MAPYFRVFGPGAAPVDLATGEGLCPKVAYRNTFAKMTIARALFTDLGAIYIAQIWQVSQQKEKAGARQASNQETLILSNGAASGTLEQPKTER